MESPESVQNKCPNLAESQNQGRDPVQQIDCISEARRVSWGRCLLLGFAGWLGFLMIGFGLGAAFKGYNTIIGYFFGYSGIPLFVLLVLLSATYQRGKKLLALALAVPAVLLVGIVGLVGTVPKILRESPVLSVKDRQPLVIRQMEGSDRLWHPHLKFSFPANLDFEEISPSLPPLDTQSAPLIHRYLYQSPSQGLLILVQVTRGNGLDETGFRKHLRELKQSLLEENPQVLFADEFLEWNENSRIARLTGQSPNKSFFVAISYHFTGGSQETEYLVNFIASAPEQAVVRAFADQIAVPR